MGTVELILVLFETYHKVNPSIASEKPPLGCRWGGLHTGPALMGVTPVTEAGGVGMRARKKERILVYFAGRDKEGWGYLPKEVNSL